MAENKKLPIMGHLEEFRKRLVRIAIAVVIGTAISFYFVEDIINTLKSVADNIQLQAIEPTETIGTYFKLSFTCGLVFATPVILYEIVMFIRPALTPNERRYLYTLLPSVLISFVLGVLFAYWVLLPPAMSFLFNFGSNVATIEWRLSNYIDMVVRLLFVIGLCFELPIVMYFLTKIGVVTVQKLSRFRKFAFILAFIVAAIVTPTPDPINQTIVAGPMMVLYEIGILLARIAQRGKRKNHK